MTKATQEKITLPKEYRDVIGVLKELHSSGVSADDVITALKALNPASDVPLEGNSTSLSSARLSKDAILEAISRSDRLISVPYGTGPEGLKTTHIGGAEWQCSSSAVIKLVPDDKGRDINLSRNEALDMHRKHYMVIKEMSSGSLSKTGDDAVFVEARQQISGQPTHEALAITLRMPGFSGRTQLVTEVPASIAERTQQLVREGELSVGEVIKAIAGSRFVRDLALEGIKIDKEHGCAIYLNREGDVSVVYPEALN